MSIAFKEIYKKCKKDADGLPVLSNKYRKIIIDDLKNIEDIDNLIYIKEDNTLIPCIFLFLRDNEIFEKYKNDENFIKEIKKFNKLDIKATKKYKNLDFIGVEYFEKNKKKYDEQARLIKYEYTPNLINKFHHLKNTVSLNNRFDWIIDNKLDFNYNFMLSYFPKILIAAYKNNKLKFNEDDFVSKKEGFISGKEIKSFLKEYLDNNIQLYLDIKDEVEHGIINNKTNLNDFIDGFIETTQELFNLGAKENIMKMVEEKNIYGEYMMNFYSINWMDYINKKNEEFATILKSAVLKNKLNKILPACNRIEQTKNKI